jgi:hypothetical protein
MTQPSQSPLSYSFPSFKPEHYDNLEPKFKTLKSYGFEWITFTPTYKVTETKQYPLGYVLPTVVRQPPLIYWFKRLFGMYKTEKKRTVYKLDTSTMPMTSLQSAVNLAVKEGFNVKIEPHLDFAATFSGNSEDEWRMNMHFRPNSPDDMRPAYDTSILFPIFDILHAASKLPRPVGKGPACFALTLGSELDISLFVFSPYWDQTLSTLKTMRKAASLDNPFRLSFGHKLNHDSHLLETHLGYRLNRLRNRIGLETYDKKQLNNAATEVKVYLQNLDYCSFSFYPDFSVEINGKPLDFTTPPQADEVKAIGDALGKYVDQLRKFYGDGVPLDIGEAGTGSADPLESYNDVPREFVEKDTNGNYKKKDQAHAARRKYLLGLEHMLNNKKAEFAAKSPNCSNYLPLTFWTIKQYDFLGLWDYKVKLESGEEVDHKLFVDDELKEWVSNYNKRVYSNGE